MGSADSSAAGGAGEGSTAGHSASALIDKRIAQGNAVWSHDGIICTVMGGRLNRPGTARTLNESLFLEC